MATDTTTTRPAEAPPGPRPSGLPRDGASHVRGDIEGLRAVAVLLVIADHLFGWPHGGFIGVDVFFVISGFLITGLLLREHQSTGRISFPDFYRRRIRRILPASVLVLVVTAVMANVVFFANRAQETVDDALWALLFAGNWHFAIDGTDYQQAGDAVSPLQHYWSLSVEEQFYVVWPVVLLVVLGLAGRRHGRRGLAAMAVVTVFVVAAGFAWAMHETTSAPTWAYFSTVSRSWELGLGALLAVLAPAMVRLPAWLRPVLGWAGLAGIALGAVLIDSTTPFPAPWALVPVLSTVVVIAAGTGGDSRLLLVDTFGTSAAICNCLYGAHLLYSEDMAAAVATAINTWIAREWLDREPRLRASIVVPLQSAELSVAEIERWAPDRRFVQVLVPVLAEDPLGRRRYWPIYEAAERHGLPIGIHAGSMYRHPPTVIGWPTYYTEDYAAQAQAFQTALASLICEGVFDRFPQLKVVMIESGFTWLPASLWRLTKYWQGLRWEVPWVKRTPAQIVQEQVRFTLQPVDAPPTPQQLERFMEHLGSDRLLLFSTDYPHWQFDGIEALPEGLSPELVGRIQRDNPLETYPRLEESLQ